jgi:hypothetical protein
MGRTLSHVEAFSARGSSLAAGNVREEVRRENWYYVRDYARLGAPDMRPRLARTIIKTPRALRAGVFPPERQSKAVAALSLLLSNDGPQPTKGLTLLAIILKGVWKI